MMMKNNNGIYIVEREGKTFRVHKCSLFRDIPVQHQACRTVKRQFTLVEHGITSVQKLTTQYVMKKDHICCIFHIDVQSIQSRTNE